MKIAVWLGVAAVALGGPAAAETWQAYSRSPNNTYMADADSIATEAGITSIKVATVPKAGDPGDLSHSIETYQFRCEADQWRTAGMVEIGPDGSEVAQYPEEDAAWEPLRRETMPRYLKEIACDGARGVPPHWPSIRAFIEAGRS
ncbi:surface-adhesin E family protein [uncultured Brevundimonas sp.]|uniref:surface-adhesin E family protein n=1 Tax=uncultured Brevundimonas sp. TaxID=213418 RepID=UPI002639A6AA|nr:surface-adhesin E family protein [uncultured Brevundimonas sp.]